MKSKLLLSALLVSILLMSISFVSSIPPQTSQAELGYQIRVPQAEFFKQGRQVIAHIHVFNVSNGMPIYPSSSNVACNLHLYNTTGHPILEQTMDVDSNGLEWELTIDGGNFTEIGQMIFLVFCNDSLAGGFVSSSFEVTGTGLEFDLPRTNLSIALLSIIIFAFLVCIFGVTKLPKEDNFQDGNLISINKLKYLRPVIWGVAWFLLIALFFTASNIALAYIGTTLLGDMLFTIFNIMLILSLPMIVIWFLYIFVSVFQDRKLEKNILRGFEQ